ncbi:DUF4345 domain-containing protein [Streptomyces piniterrae]|uniref:DUF4345 domain-containing protein n=2 Tax=Streptomyces piniterrae TaxID=2571125 RepID=A0A4U0NED4_9ACTN|nr:DUF4345 domain-containing protein [Streptomyces piniterrae]
MTSALNLPSTLTTATTATTAALALFFLGMGLYGLAAPTALVRPFGIGLGGAAARTEVRAVYGGFGVAMAALLGWAAAGPTDALRRGAVLAVAVALLGMAGGRLAARLVEPPGSWYPSWFYFWAELTGGGLLLATTV